MFWVFYATQNYILVHISDCFLYKRGNIYFWVRTIFITVSVLITKFIWMIRWRILNFLIDFKRPVHFYWLRGEEIIPGGHRSGRIDAVRYQIDDKPNNQIRIPKQLPEVRVYCIQMYIDIWYRKYLRSGNWACNINCFGGSSKFLISFKDSLLKILFCFLNWYGIFCRGHIIILVRSSRSQRSFCFF